MSTASRGRPINVAPSSCSRDIRLWDVDTGTCLRIFEGHTDTIRTVQWSAGPAPCGLSASHDRTVRIWDVDTGRCLQVLEGPTVGLVSAALRADDHRAVSCDWRGGIRVGPVAIASRPVR